MHCITVVSLEMSDEPKYFFSSFLRYKFYGFHFSTNYLRQIGVSFPKVNMKLYFRKKIIVAFCFVSIV